MRNNENSCVCFKSGKPRIEDQLEMLFDRRGWLWPAVPGFPWQEGKNARDRSNIPKMGAQQKKCKCLWQERCVKQKFWNGKKHGQYTMSLVYYSYLPPDIWHQERYYRRVKHGLWDLCGPGQWFSIRGDSVPMGHWWWLKAFILGCDNWGKRCSWYLVSRGGDAADTSSNAQTALHSKGPPGMKRQQHWGEHWLGDSGILGHVVEEVLIFHRWKRMATDQHLVLQLPPA